jgi:hypothetical protein
MSGIGLENGGFDVLKGFGPYLGCIENGLLFDWFPLFGAKIFLDPGFSNMLFEDLLIILLSAD